MRRSFYSIFFVAIFLFNVFRLTPASAQEGKGSVSGTVTDTDHDVLPSAPVTLSPGDISVKTNVQGEFTFTNLAPGAYTVTASYLGFSDSTNSVTVSAGQVAKVDAVLTVASVNEQMVVTAGRSYGEAETVNEIRAADNLVNILPATVITSLPNANIADAVGRLAGVTLARDEGEGKYVQIRGTAPNLSNLTIDGFVVPSPEGGVRQVKLDTIPADLIESVQINKTLQANMDADAIGGSVNLVTKTARERPTISLFGTGGFTPIIDTVPVNEFGGTVGQRFGRDKRFGVIVSGGYDYNGRGINDVEPVPDPTSVTPNYTSAAIRDYRFDRKRYGVGGSVDYKIGEGSIYAKVLYSDFKDFGRRWEYVLATNPTNSATPSFPTITTERRLGDYLVSSLLLGGNHVFTKTSFNWGLSASHSRLLNPISGGESITNFAVDPTMVTANNCQYDPAATTDKFEPQFAAACFTDNTTGAGGVYEPNKFILTSIVDSAHGKSDQVNLAAFASVARNYHLGSHASTFELGFKIRNGHKFDNSYSITHTPSTPPLESQFLGGFNDPNYYSGGYKFAPNSPSWDSVNAYLAATPGNFPPTGTSTTAGGNISNFDLVERITAGYIMDTLDFGRFRLIAGVRIEGTNESTLGYDVVKQTFTVKGGGSYVTPLPSASLRFRLDNSSDLKMVYSRAILRPDPALISGAFQFDTGTAPPSVIVGNAALKPEHAHNYDLLYERYLTPLGLFQAGFFYKQLSDPVVQTLSTGDPTFCGSPAISAAINTSAGCLVSTPSNGGNAYVTGFEAVFQYHFANLPGLLSGLGVEANYSYATSQATGVSKLRTDNPAVLSQAPHTWNISPTYDRGRLSLRVGLGYNGANIFQYAYRNLMPDPANPANTLPNPQAGGVHGPAGDVYYYSHFQVDAQGSFRIGKGLKFIASGLNLNNEVYGFYLGSPQYVFQREYYKPTYSFGFRWDLGQE